MQAKPTAVITGGLIEASHLNNLVDYYNEFWNDPISSCRCDRPERLK